MLEKVDVNNILVYTLLLLACNLKLSLTSKQGDEVSVNFDQVEELIKNGLEETNLNAQVKENLVIVLGLPGSGKTTLINYLNKVGLRCYKNNKTKKWVVDLANSTKSLGDFFKIDHDQKSEKFCPSSYSPSGYNITFIESRVIQSTDYIEKKLATSFLNEKVLKKDSNLKFILLIDYEDTYQDSNKLGSIFTQLNHLIGSSETIYEFPYSIGIVLTKVKPQNKTQHDIKLGAFKEFQSVVMSLFGKYKISENYLKVFERIPFQNIQLFTNPQKDTQNLEDLERHEILLMIDRIHFMSKQVADIKVKINKAYVPLVYEYISRTNNQQLTKYTKILKENLPKKLVSVINDVISLQHTQTFEKFYQFQEKSSGLEILDAHMFTDGINEKNKATLKRNLIDFLIEQIPINHRLYTDTTDPFKNFYKPIFHSELEAKIRRIESNLENKLTKTINKFSKLHLEKCESAYEGSLIKNEVNDLVKETEFVKSIRSILKKTMNSSLIELGSHVNQILASINNQTSDMLQFDDESDKLIYKGSLLSMKTFAQKLEALSTQITDLKLIRIYAANCFIFDSDFKIHRKYYKQDAPDLVIISPNVLMSNNTVVDLSCENTPPYPDNQKHARDAVGYFKVTFVDILKSDEYNLSLRSANANDTHGYDGMYGKNGLRGYKGGDMHIFTENFDKNYDLTFVSHGGKGGPGQFGGHASILKNGSVLRKQNTPQASWKCLKDGLKGRGGVGGKGGLGGFGGLHGQLLIYELKIVQNEQFIKVYNETINTGSGLGFRVRYIHVRYILC